MPQPPYDSPEPSSGGSPHSSCGTPSPGGSQPYGRPQGGKSSEPPRISPGARTFLMVYMAIGAVALLAAMIWGGFFGIQESSRWAGPRTVHSMAVRTLPPGTPLYPGFAGIVGYNFHSATSGIGGRRTSTRTVRIGFRCKDRLPTVGAWYEGALRAQGYARMGRTAGSESYTFQRSDGTSLTLTESRNLFNRRGIVMVVEQTTGPAGPAGPAGPVGPMLPGVAPRPVMQPPVPPPPPPPPPPPSGTAAQRGGRTASAAQSIIPS